MKILVTGGSGFIGSHISKHFVSKGEEVAEISRTSPTDIDREILVIRGNVSSLSDVVGAVVDSEAEVVIHTAGLLTAESQKDPPRAFEINVRGTLNVLEAARIKDARRVICMSSTAAYGATKEGELVDEDYPKNPVTLYGAQKLFCEYLGETYQKNYGLSFVALRISVVYGPGQSLRGFAAFKEIIEKPIYGEEAVVEAGGEQKYDAVYVKDIARSVWLAAQAENLRHWVFNVGGGNQCTLWDLANIVKKYRPDARFRIGPGLDIAEPIRGPLDITRAEKELGYKPNFSIEEGVKDYVETIMEHVH